MRSERRTFAFACYSSRLLRSGCAAICAKKGAMALRLPRAASCCAACRRYSALLYVVWIIRCAVARRRFLRRAFALVLAADAARARGRLRLALQILEHRNAEASCRVRICAVFGRRAHPLQIESFQ